jgi:hypothetical protein
MLAAGRLALVEDRVTGTSPADSLWLAAAKYAQEAEWAGQVLFMLLCHDTG